MVLLDVLFAGGVAGAGMGLGWWLRGSPALPAPQPVAPPVESEDAIKAREVLQKLQELAKNVAANMGAHAKNVESINNDLRASSPDDVLSVVDKLIHANEAMNSQLRNAESKLEEQAREIQTQASAARTDALSGLNNRRAFDDELGRRVAEHARQGRPVSFMMVDVDHFKKFNDTHGHAAGDAVIKGVAEVLKKAAREMDFVARYGGEEFAVLFPGTQLDDAKKAGERMRAAITNTPFLFEGLTLRVTSSAGVAEIMSGETGELLVKRADEALYAAKTGGRNQGHYHNGQGILPIVPKPAVVEAPKPTAPTAPVPAAPAPVAAAPTPAPAKPTTPAKLGELVPISTRTSFGEDVQRRVSEFKRGGAPLSIILVGIDSFPEYESDPGAKDMVLRATSNFLRATMREMDHVARYDEDTFALLLPTAKQVDAVKVAGRLSMAVQKTRLKYGEAGLQFTVSIGVAEAKKSDESERLVQRAEAALESAQAQGTNRIVCEHGNLLPEPAKEAPVA